MLNRFASRGFIGRRLAAARLGLCLLGPAVSLAGCNHYDFGDIVDALDGGEGHGHGHGGSGGHGGGCVLDGEHYRPGESFPSPDGCNTCSCNEDGQVACTLRFCVATCGGITGQACAEGEYCSFPPEAQCGAGDQTGFCAAQPDICTLQYDPVCGCDGLTYGNACAAASAGISVASDGECGGPQCEADSDCPIPPCACLDEDQDGQCENTCPVPICRDGVCGVASPDALQLGESCGGFRPANSAECDVGLFCQHQAGALCGAADAPGECVLIPDACTKEYAPVCGCDGKTYGNACEAAAALAGIFELGECQ